MFLAALAVPGGCTTRQGESTSTTASQRQLSTAAADVFDLDGNSFDPLSQESAKVTVLVFTRADCPISNRFAPEIGRLYETFHPRGVDFYLVYVDPHEAPQAIRHHLAEYRYSCAAVRDPGHILVALCQATTTPETAVFDQNHKIAYQGRINDLYIDLGSSRPQPTTNDLADAIDATLAGQPVANPHTKPVGCLIADLKQ
jgi:AhpC/TSA family